MHVVHVLPESPVPRNGDVLRITEIVYDEDRLFIYYAVVDARA